MAITRPYVVYKHTAPNGKAYVGLTKDYQARNRCHKHGATGCAAFVAAVKKHGWDSFTHEVLIENLDLVAANFFERLFIVAENTMAPAGYNLKEGGASAPCSKETREKISKAQKGIPKQYAPWNLGRGASLETRAKQSAAATARTYCPEKIAAMTQANLGNKYRLGHKASAETRAKMSKSHSGRKMPEGALQKAWETRRLNQLKQMEA